MDKMKLPELKAEARKRKIKGFSTMRKAELLAALQGGEKPKEKEPEKKSSLGPIPFNLVKQFMLEKKEDEEGGDYDVLTFTSFMLRELSAEVSPRDTSLTEQQNKKITNLIEYFLKKIRIQTKRLGKKFPLYYHGDGMQRVNRYIEDKRYSMTEDDLKAYYAKFGIVVEPFKRKLERYKDSFSVRQKQKAKGITDTTDVKLMGISKDAKTKIDKFLSGFGKENVKAKVAARPAEKSEISKPKAKRCPKGSRKDKKTGKCV